jgi:hypothetical protein
VYQFSRSIYRELAGEIIEDHPCEPCRNRQAFLASCEACFERLANDRHYFARPVRTLFNDVRFYFPMKSQARVYQVISTHMEIATAYVDQRAREGMTLDGAPLSCHATTRKGSPCQRVPLPGSKYCPSHKHLDDEFETVVLPTPALDVFDEEFAALGAA